MPKLHGSFGDSKRTSAKPLQNGSPVDSRKCPESEKALQSKLSVFHILHPSTGVLGMRCYGHAPQDPSSSGRILAGHDRVTQLCGYRDKIERRVSAGHYDARDSHDIEATETMVPALSIVELDGRYSPRNSLSLCINPIGEGFALDEHQEDEGWPVDKAHVCLSNVVGFATNNKRDGVTAVHTGGGGTLVEAEELQCLCSEVDDETLLGGSGGVVEVTEVFGGGIGKVRVVITGRSVENGGIDVIKRWVWGREELFWWCR